MWLVLCKLHSYTLPVHNIILLILEKVNAEVRSIMGPSISSLYCATTNSLRKITRKPKQKAVSEALSKSKKGVSQQCHISKEAGCL